MIIDIFYKSTTVANCQQKQILLSNVEYTIKIELHSRFIQMLRF